VNNNASFIKMLREEERMSTKEKKKNGDGS
jgi:hypothetical protein